ncbi:MAG: NUDIX hydrolase [Clostridia bacterium]|jgi:8-oxo-dGTP pyrophosphatase MutT (NUDIX family)|nr:NUDIX hydrolase [Clostridia bacterium]
MATFTWFDGEVPNGTKITQVYGLVFTPDGRMLIIGKDKKDRVEYSLIGGTPEDFDVDKEATLRRELLEEANTALGNEIHMVGYQLVDEENGIPPYAQVRMMAMIDSIGPSQPDPDNGQTYQRILTTPDRVIELLKWGTTGEKQVKAAVQMAKQYFGISSHLDKEEIV